MANTTKDSGIVNIHGKEYQTVAKRVQDFREKHPDYTLETVIIERNAEEVVMRALISDENGRLIATGYAEERRDAGSINRTSALENAETSAIGRALANFGMAGTEYASADEVAQAISQQGQTKPQASPHRPPTGNQLDLIATLAKEKGHGADWIALTYDKIKTSADASAVIERLKG